MTYDWSEFLTLAEGLFSAPDSPGPPEAAFRTAASRAYYSAFHSALTLACREGYQAGYMKDDHRGVPAHFRDSRHRDALRSKIATELDRLRDFRNEADYRHSLTPSSPKSLADLAIRMAKSVLQNVNCVTIARMNSQ